MKGYLRNRATGEIHNVHPGESCNTDDMAAENRDWLSWPEFLEWLQKGGVGPEQFCGHCWKTDD